MSCSGEVKSFNDMKGWGFIVYDGFDVFVHVKDCTDGRPKPGDQVTFDIEEDQRRQGQKKALNVTGCTGAMDGSDKGAGKGGKGGAKGTGSCQGSVKSFNDTKGWGFIDHNGTDVFLHIRDCHEGRPVPGDWVTFDIQEDQVGGKPGKKATNVSGCSGQNGKGFDKGKGKGQDSYGPMWGAPPAWGGDPWGGFGGGYDAWGGKGGMPWGCSPYAKGGWDGGKGGWDAGKGGKGCWDGGYGKGKGW